MLGVQKHHEVGVENKKYNVFEVIKRILGMIVGIAYISC